MAIINARQYFLDTLVEMTGIKSGLAVTIPEAIELLQRDPPGEMWWQGDPAVPLRLHLEEVESVFVQLLFLVGAIPDALHPKFLLYNYAKTTAVPLPEEYASDDSPEVPRLMNVTGYLETTLLGHLTDGDPLPPDLLALPGFPELLRQYAIREIMDDNLPESREWNGIIRLNDLFESEAAPSQPDTYFDQRFIEYLNAQNPDLSRMNWRQFERLTAEYFKRCGYRVTLGPGRADGGIDVRAEKERIFAGPEVILIQCKRLSGDYEVEINDVKALYADARDESAKGLIATTTRLAKGARDYCDARHYHLSRAERANVGQWLRNMTRHQG